MFLWQFLSWSVTGIHGDEMKYTDKQDAILQALSQQNLEEGTYFIPQAPPGSSSEQMQAHVNNSVGKPWAQIHYDTSMSGNMGMNMARGFLIDLVAVFLMVWLLGKFQRLDLKTALLSSIAVGVIGYLTIPYLNSIWFETNSIGHLIDAIGSWGLVGLWLGWYLPKYQRA